MSEKRARILFISPCLPHPTGNGPAMRAYSVLSVLAERYSVHLLAGSRYFPCDPKVISKELTWLCETVSCIPFQVHKDPSLILRAILYRFSPRLYHHIYLEPWEYFPLTARSAARLGRSFPSGRIDLVHVFRLYMYPVGELYLRRNPSAPCQLDLDDVESETRQRIGILYGLNGDTRMARLASIEAGLFQRIERKVLPNCSRLFVCSEVDRARLSSRYHLHNVSIVPNTIRLPAEARVKNPPEDGFTFLFVGSMKYYPNRDAVSFFCREILPVLQKTTSRNITFKIVGSGADREITGTVDRSEGIELIGQAPDLESLYDRADAVVVPIRAGGGTRIKVLEAFAHKRPVVSTHAGMEGIDACHGVHALMAEGAREFAARCGHLVEDSELGRRLAENAFQLIRAKYNLDVIRGVLLGT